MCTYLGTDHSHSSRRSTLVIHKCVSLIQVHCVRICMKLLKMVFLKPPFRVQFGSVEETDLTCLFPPKAIGYVTLI